MRKLPLLLLTAILAFMPVESALPIEKDLSEVAANDPDGDNDNDGLSNSEEGKSATSPVFNDSDGDGTLDGNDGWALDPDLAPPRLPPARYAVVKLNLSTGWPIDLTDDLQVAFYANPADGVWKDGVSVFIPSNVEVWGNPSSNGRFAATKTTTSQESIPGIWSAQEGFVELPEYQTSLPHGSGSFTTVKAASNNGAVGNAGATSSYYHDLAESSFTEYWGEFQGIRWGASGSPQPVAAMASDYGNSSQDPVWHLTGIRYEFFPGTLSESGIITGGVNYVPYDRLEGEESIGEFIMDASGAYAIFSEATFMTANNWKNTPLVSGYINENGNYRARVWAKVGSTWKEKLPFLVAGGNRVSPSLDVGVGQVNDRGEFPVTSALHGIGLSQNHTFLKLDDHVAGNNTVTDVRRINNSGIILAGIIPSGTSTPVSALLVPLTITFEAVNDNANLSDNKYSEWAGIPFPIRWTWMPGKGKRIFPDAKTPNDNTPRNRVRVKVNAAIPNIQVHLRALDVDDPSSNTTIDPNDQPGLESGNDNLEKIGSSQTRKPALFVANGSETIVCTTDENGIAKINGNLPQLEVTMQPGDNFRVAVALMENGAGEVAGLQVMNKNAAGYVPSGDKQPSSGFNGVVSPMLTTWRKLHIEADSMEKWQGDKPPPDRDLQTGQEPWNESAPLFPILTLQNYITESDDFYTNGRIVSGSIEMDIISNTYTTITVLNPNGSTPLTTGQKSAFTVSEFEVFDDDDSGISGDPLPRANLINDEVKEKFLPAYIEVEEISDEDLNPNRTIPFELNNSILNPASNLDASQDMYGADRPEYWYHMVVAAYQPGTTMDADPDDDGGLQGATGATFAFGTIEINENFSAIFVEVVREKVAGSLGTFSDIFQAQMDTVVAHEIAHPPGGNSGPQDHDEGGLMSDDPHYTDSNFTSKSLYRLRLTKQWK